MALPAELRFASPPVLVATFFGVGLLPWAPGTWASLATLPVAWLFHAVGGPHAAIIAIPVVFFAGWWASAEVSRRTTDHDPGYIVIDEVAGQLVVIAAVAPDPLLYAIGFALFRLFDIVKPAFIGWADRTVAGGLGVMLDDLFAGACGALVLLAVINVWGL